MKNLRPEPIRYTSELSQLTTGTSSTRAPATLPGVRALFLWAEMMVMMKVRHRICTISKCHADLQPRFYLIRWGGVSPTVEYTVYSGVNVRGDAIHA